LTQTINLSVGEEMNERTEAGRAVPDCPGSSSVESAQSTSVDVGGPKVDEGAKLRACTVRPESGNINGRHLPECSHVPVAFPAIALPSPCSALLLPATHQPGKGKGEGSNKCQAAPSPRPVNLSSLSSRRSAHRLHRIHQLCSLPSIQDNSILHRPFPDSTA
jgi:hypothetical protein